MAHTYARKTHSHPHTHLPHSHMGSTAPLQAQGQIYSERAGFCSTYSMAPESPVVLEPWHMCYCPCITLLSEASRGIWYHHWGRSKHRFEAACLTCTGQSLEIAMGSVVCVLAHLTVLSPASPLLHTDAPSPELCVLGCRLEISLRQSLYLDPGDLSPRWS